RSASTACAPAKPPPRITTWGQLAPSFAGTVGRRVRNGSGRTMGRTPCAAERRSGRGWWPGGSLSACGRGEHLGEGLGTVPDPSRAGAEIVGRGRGAESGPFEVPADGTHSAPSGPRTERGGATRDTRKAIPSGDGARTDRSARPRRPRREPPGSRRSVAGPVLERPRRPVPPGPPGPSGHGKVTICADGPA